MITQSHPTRMSKRPRSTQIQRLGFEKTRNAPSSTGNQGRHTKTRCASSLSSLFALSSETAFQRSWQELPVDAQVLVRDFVFRKGVIMWCIQGETMQIGAFRYVPLMTDPWAMSSNFFWPCRATPLAARDRVWVCERALRTRSMGTVVFVLNHRKKANLVEDAEDKELEDGDFRTWTERSPYY
jgi:hypothetical protein